MMDWGILSQNAIVSGTLSGLVSGLLVASMLDMIERRSRPRLELHQINEDTALLRNNGFRSVAFGDTFIFEQGNCQLYPKDGFRGHISEMRCKGHDEIVVGCKASLGDTVSITYKLLWWWQTKPTRHWRDIQREASQADVMEVFSRNSKPWWTLHGIRRRWEFTHPAEGQKPVRLWNWKSAHLPLKPL